MKYPKVYNELTEILSKHHVCYGTLKGTSDYWCRDYMPEQVDNNSFLLKNVLNLSNNSVYSQKV